MYTNCLTTQNWCHFALMDVGITMVSFLFISIIYTPMLGFHHGWIGCHVWHTQEMWENIFQRLLQNLWHWWTIKYCLTRKPANVQKTEHWIHHLTPLRIFWWNTEAEIILCTSTLLWRSKWCKFPHLPMFSRVCTDPTQDPNVWMTCLYSGLYSPLKNADRVCKPGIITKNSVQALKLWLVKLKIICSFIGVSECLDFGSLCLPL